jgi:hypothetical protein
MPADSISCESCGAAYVEPDMGLLESRLTPEQEAAVPIAHWLSTALGILGLAGAAWGSLAIVWNLAASAFSLSAAIISTIFAVLFLFGGYAGVLAIKRSRGWLHYTTLFCLIQVPVLSSPLLSYTFASGGLIIGWVQIYPPVHIGTNLFLGSTFTFNLFSSTEPIRLGVNFVALAITVLLVRAQR